MPAARFATTYRPSVVDQAVLRHRRDTARAYAEAAEDLLDGPLSLVPFKSGRLQRSLRAQAVHRNGRWRVQFTSRLPYAGLVLYGRRDGRGFRSIERTLRRNSARLAARTTEILRRRQQ